MPVAFEVRDHLVHMVHRLRLDLFRYHSPTVCLVVLAHQADLTRQVPIGTPPDELPLSLIGQVQTGEVCFSGLVECRYSGHELWWCGRAARAPTSGREPGGKTVVASSGGASRDVTDIRLRAKA
jgi:hypothetical protein